MPAAVRLSRWAPWAKGFGGVLNLSCSLIVLPVSRTFIRYLYNLSNHQTSSAKFLRGILFFFPLDKALEFHYICAWVILAAAMGHTICHFGNLGLRTDASLGVFNIWSYLSGALIVLCMQGIYAGTRPEVKRGHFEIFWYSHHLFIGFFVLLLLHGRNGFGPNYWKYFLIPGTIYVFERIYRERSAYRAVAIVSITNMHERVLVLEFDKKAAFPSGFKEGQYVFLNCPFVSWGQWHPFTLSSAPQDSTATVHIRVQGTNSWTRQLLDYLTLLGPANQDAHFKLYSQTAEGLIPGKVLGPDGKQLLRVYGPLSAPTQHISEYQVDMIIGAGIGVTPVCSCLQSIVQHTWKFSTGLVFPSHALFYWVCSHEDLPSFRWMVRIIKQAVDVVNGFHERGELTEKTFEFHIFMTSVPDVVPANFGYEDYEDEVKSSDMLSTKFWGRGGDFAGVQKIRSAGAEARRATAHHLASEFEEDQLYQALIRPPSGDSGVGKFVHVHRGRPDWSKMFGQVRDRFLGKEIGVAFCGNPKIGADLKKSCQAFSSLESKTLFRLHKENF